MSALPRHRLARAALLVLLASTAGFGASAGFGATAGRAATAGPGAYGATTRQPTRQAAAAEETVRVVAYNVHHGEGTDGRLDLKRIAALIRDLDPDLVTLQEVDSSVERTGFVDQAAVYGRLTGMAWAFGAFMPYQGGEYGMAVLSRWPILAVANHRLPDGAEPRTALAVRVRSPRSGRELELVGVHLYRTAAERLAQAEALSALYADAPVAVILAGDFNSLPDSEVMRRIADGWRIIDKGADRFTFPSTRPERQIDYFAVRPADSFRVRSQALIDEPVASDHRPLFVELVWSSDGPLAGRVRSSSDRNRP